MAWTLHRYNHTSKLFLNKEVTFATLKVYLLNASASFVATHTQLTQVSNGGANQVSGNGWDVGGELLQSVAVSINNTSEAMLDADDLSIVATGGDIGPVSAIVVMDDTPANKPPLLYYQSDAPVTAAVGTPFAFRPNVGGLFRVNEPA